MSLRGRTQSIVRLALAVVSVWLLAACADESGSATRPSAPGGSVAQVAPSPGPTATAQVLPSLYPTFTPQPLPTATATIPLPPTKATQPELDLSEEALEFRYTVPALGLERRVEATVAGTVQVIDETTGLIAIRRNQGPVVQEIQEALVDVQLEPLPAGCMGCVQLRYELPLSGEQGEGWLQDPLLLASIENFTAASLGAHFPPDTVAGLRRAVSAYDPAHTVALTSTGLVWRWIATDSVIAEPVPAGELGNVPDLAELPLDQLQEDYLVECPLVPLESLYLDPAPAAGDEAARIQILCPAFSLPARLLPVYLFLTDAIAPVLAEQDQQEPPPLELPLDTLVYYERADGARLTLQLSGQAVAVDATGAVITGTLPVTDVVSVNSGLAQSGALVPGVAIYTAAEEPNILLVRGPLGLLELGWGALVPPALEPFLVQLNEQLDALVGTATPAPRPAEGNATPTSSPGTPTTTPTP